MSKRYHTSHFHQIHILGGGTFSHIRNHMSLATPAFGETARQLSYHVSNQLEQLPEHSIFCHLTKMANHYSTIVTNNDVSDLVDQLIADPLTKIIFFNVAMCDFDGEIDGEPSGKYAPRLSTRGRSYDIRLTAAEKVIKKIRKERKDIFLVAFKTTCNASETEQYIAGLNLLKENSCNLVLANDTGNHRNMIIVPEEAKYCVTTDREEVLRTLVDMTMKRSKLTYTRSTVVDAPSVDWNDPLVPESLRTVVNYCIEKGAYKPFRGNTAGHFAVKVDDETFLTSKRSSNFNDLDKIGLVKVVSSGPDEVIAYGAKPSVGGQSQRIIFKEHDDVDCIVHFHSPLASQPFGWLPDSKSIPVRAQYPYECGSHECGQNTSTGLSEVWSGIKAVMLDEHGPNIVFNRNIDPKRVIDFIETFFDLSQKTGGPVAI